MEPIFDFPSEAGSPEDTGRGTKLTKDENYPTLCRINDSLTTNDLHTYLQETPVDNLKSDLKTFEIEAMTLREATQEAVKKDREWKRGLEMTVSGTNALMGIMLTLGVVPDGISRKDLQGEMPIKREIFPLLDKDYQLRVDIETKNLMIRKSQLEILRNIAAHKTDAATGVPFDAIQSSTANLFSDIESSVVAKEGLKSKLHTVQHERGLVEAKFNAYRQAHPFDESKMDGTNLSSKLHKTLDDIKAGRQIPRASIEDSLELPQGMTMQTTDEMTGKVAWGKDTAGRSIEQIAKEEGKTLGEILEEVGEAKKDFEVKERTKRASKGRSECVRLSLRVCA